MIRVLVVDDQEMIRTALRLIIDRRDDLHVVGEAADGAAAVLAALELRPDVIVMDVRMPGVNGVEATRQLHESWPDAEPPRVLVLTTFDLDEYVHAALRVGASGFLLKNTSPDQLADGIRTVAAGESMLAPSVTRRLIRAFTALPSALVPSAEPERPVGTDPIDTLTERERDVLVLLAQGLSNAQIAGQLNVSETNVKSRVRRILNRLGLDNRVQAALLAHESGLLS
jgi:DNA-binding NarL/FixJ family response regulator